MVLGLLRFSAHSLLIPIGAAPAKWTQVQLYFSPALAKQAQQLEQKPPASPAKKETTQTLAPPSPEEAGPRRTPSPGVETRAAAARRRSLQDDTPLPTASTANGSGKQEEEEIRAAVPQLRELFSAHVPSLSDPAASFAPTPWLTSGHLQTIYSAKVDTLEEDPILYRRRVLLLPDGGTISLDITPPELGIEGRSKEEEVPTVVVLHGLTGGSGETYVRNALKPITKAKQDGGLGYRGIVVNFRACGNTPVTSPQLYSASKTSDLRSALLFITKTFPHSPLAGLGFSLGANILAKYMGEQGSETPLRGVAVMGAPFDCLRGSEVLDQAGINRSVYSTAMAGNLNRVVGRAIDVLSLEKTYALPAVQRLLHPPPKAQCRKERDGVTPGTLKYVDDSATRVLGGHHRPYGEFPFEDANSYYAGASSLPVLHNVQRPLLAINALDDPIVPVSLTGPVRTVMGLEDNTGVLREGQLGLRVQTRGEGNPNIVLALTPHGGHLGWWSGAGKPQRWISQPIVEYVRMLLEEDDFAHLAAKPEDSLWNRPGRLVEREVEVDLLPLKALRRWEDPEATANGDSKKLAAEDANGQEEVKEGAQAGPTPAGPGNDMLGWLTTKLLDHAPLVHPFDHPYYASSEPIVSSNGHAEGRLTRSSSARSALGKPPTASNLGEQRQSEMRSAPNSKTLRLRMVQDTQRPESGYAELDENCRVAGAGAIFYGGKDVPGGAKDGIDGHGWAKAGGDGVVKGL